MRILVILLLLVIVGSLFSGLFFMYRDKSGGARVARALTVRIGLSLFLFLLLMAGFYFGFIPANKL